MVKFEPVGANEFAILEAGEVTLDDPVGDYLFKNSQKRRNRITLGGRKVTYLEALDELESGNVLRTDYEILLKKATPRSISQNNAMARASPILRDERKIVDALFGEFADLSPSDQRKLVEACSTITNFKEYARPVLEKRVEDIPDRLAIWREKFLRIFDNEAFSGFALSLDQFRSALAFNFDYDYKLFINTIIGRQYRKRYHKLSRGGNVFEYAKLYKEMQASFPVHRGK